MPRRIWIWSILSDVNSGSSAFQYCVELVQSYDAVVKIRSTSITLQVRDDRCCSPNSRVGSISGPFPGNWTEVGNDFVENKRLMPERGIKSIWDPPGVREPTLAPELRASSRLAAMLNTVLRPLMPVGVSEHNEDHKSRSVHQSPRIAAA
jgi:hypothetical protein